MKEKDEILNIFRQTAALHEQAVIENLDAMMRAVEMISGAFRSGKKLLLFGNGGSAADSQHIAAEFIGRFQKERKSLPAIALTTDTSILTSLGNDYGFDVIFSRQVEGLGQEGDVAMGISTSGNSRNVIEAVKTAKERGMKSISLTGNDGGELASLTDVSIIVPSAITARVQESHICIAHCICELVENRMAS